MATRSRLPLLLDCQAGRMLAAGGHLVATSSRLLLLVHGQAGWKRSMRLGLELSWCILDVQQAIHDLTDAHD